MTVDEIYEETDREMARIKGLTYEEYKARLERNKGRIDPRKAEFIGEDGKIYYVDEYEEKFEGKKQRK